MHKPILWTLLIPCLAVLILKAPPSAGAWKAGPFPQQRSAQSDRQALIDLENEWLTARDAATLDRILAPDFVHPVPTGDFLTKQQHIDWFTRHPAPANFKFSFGRLDIRLYGDLGIANGIVITSDQTGKELSSNVFTDVFAFRNGLWQAINGQETDVQKAR
jgi:hypothetical protein